MSCYMHLFCLVFEELHFYVLSLNYFSVLRKTATQGDRELRCSQMGVIKLKKLLKHEREIYLEDLGRTVDNISTIRGVGVVDISGWLVTFLTSNLYIK